jgi:hypothetical protein
MACTASESERALQAAALKQARDTLLTEEVVQALMTPTSAGRLIYDHPAPLSYDSLRLTRPDLLLTADRPKR